MSSSSSTPSLQHLYKEAYQLTDRANVGSFAAHEFAPVHMLLVQRGSDDDTPLTDVQAAQNAFTSLSAHKASASKAAFCQWFQRHFEACDRDRLASRVFHLNKFIERKHRLSECFHLLDATNSSRLPAGDVQAFLKRAWGKEITEEQVKKAMEIFDPKHTGTVTVYPFLVGLYWLTRKDDIHALEAKLNPIIAERRHALLHHVFDAFSHHKAALSSDEVAAFLRLDPAEVTGNKVKLPREKKATASEKMKKHADEHQAVEEKEFVPLLDELTSSLKAVQLSKLVDGYVSAAPSAFRSAGEAKATEGSESAAAAAVVGPQMARLGHKEGRKKPAVEAMERKAHK